MDYSCGVKRIYQTNHRATKDKSSPPNPKKRTRQDDIMPAEKPTQCSRRNGQKGVDVISANNLKSEKRGTEKSYFWK